MYIIYLDYGGSVANQMQIHFSILSFLAYTTRKPRIIIATDHPEAYKRLEGLVETLEVTPDTFKMWRGEMDYSFRIKIKVIQYVVQHLMNKQLPPSAVMYMDGDTVACSNWDLLYDEVTKGVAYMHINEGMPYLTHGPSARLWRDVKGKQYAGIKIDETSEMWNAGVIAMPLSKATEVCDLALRLCDEMLNDGVRSFHVEQFSFTLAMRHICHEIHSAESYICHYWGNKKGWNKVQADFFTRSLIEMHTPQEDMLLIKEMDKSVVPYYVKVPIWRQRFLKWIDCIAPQKQTSLDKK